MDNLVTKSTLVLQRDDGSEARIVATAFFGSGLHRSVDVYVHAGVTLRLNGSFVATLLIPTGGPCLSLNTLSMGALRCSVL